MKRRTTQRGATLVELLVSIVIVSIAAATVLGVLATTTAGSADPMIRHQAAAIAEAYLEEIMLKPLDDPDGADGETVRAAFDDVDDYDGLVDAGARDQFGNAVPALSNYVVSVTVTGTGALAPATVGDVRRVDVNVQHSTAVNFVLSGYRARL